MNLSALHAEFDRWAAMNMAAPIWWRDDDAVADSLALDRLLDLSAKFAVPLTLAVIPKPVDQSLANRIQANELITVAQHGWSHANHGAAGEKAIELGGLVDEAALIGNLKTGRKKLQDMFGQSVPMLVPPWNRITTSILNRLPELGFARLSAFGNRPAVDEMANGLARFNAHADPIAWHDGRDFAGEDNSLRPLIDYLGDLRMHGNFNEPAGIMTHHLVHSERVWQFVEAFARLVAKHPGANWVSSNH